MNYQNIKVFQAILEHQNISAAAKSLNYTRSTVSEALKQLEEELGVQLIVRERGVRQVTLTPAGKKFVPLVNEWEEMDQHLHDFVRASKQRVLRLAAGTRAHEEIIPRIVRCLKQDLPNLTVQLVYLPDGSAWSRDLKSQTFDAAIYYGRVDEHPMLVNVPLFCEARCILCPANTVFPDRVLTPEDLDVAFEVQYSKTGYVSAQGPVWRRTCHLEGEPMMKVPGWTAIEHYLTDPRCWALMPSDIALQTVSRRPQELTIRQIAPEPPPLPCSLVVFRSYTDTEVLQCILKSCAEYAEERPHLKQPLVP